MVLEDCKGAFDIVKTALKKSKRVFSKENGSLDLFINRPGVAGADYKQPRY